MKRIEHYQPPTAAVLARFKDELGFTSPQTADLAGLAGGSRWRKYTGSTQPREFNPHMHFYMVALLTLTPDEWERVAGKMCEHGAKLGLGPLPAGLSRNSQN
jgi:hypothetical protein